MGVYRRGDVAHQVIHKRKGFAMVHRSILDWEWYADTPTRSVFLHLLLTANYLPSRLRGLNVAPGQAVTSIPSLAKDLGLSEKNVRTALAHLKETGEVADKPTSWCRVVTIVKWDYYRNLMSEPAWQVAGEPAVKWQSSGSQVAASEEGNKERKQEGEELRSPASAPHPVPTDLSSQPLPPPKAARSPRSAAPSSPPAELIWPPWAGPKTKEAWEDFKEMKRSQYKFRYKSIVTEQTAVNFLAEYFDNGQDCVAALKEATAKTWKFPVDPGERSFRMPKQEPEWTPQG